ncbi:MAG: hypothetical protein JNM03_11485 [Sphingopyxis sp.]|uniref:hypothetical protein n=1 Tax=Sphingopyxis sp. TaxID=1908224 RepID=UPI001A5066C3|nr:hypothetical protein [Sphingopyxis sp.]MBL9070596.1 hypothetical protein [Sphingopyxis sp.]
MTNHEHKLARARRILAAIDDLIERHGQISPAHYPGCADHRITIDLPPLRITILPNRFRAYMAKSKTMVGEGTIERDGWRAVEICWHNSRRACFNVSGEEIDFYHYLPGRWEQAFDVDIEGDSIPIRPDLFADDKNPAWREFKQSGFAKWPPEAPNAGA